MRTSGTYGAAAPAWFRASGWSLMKNIMPTAETDPSPIPPTRKRSTSAPRTVFAPRNSRRNAALFDSRINFHKAGCTGIGPGQGNEGLRVDGIAGPSNGQAGVCVLTSYRWNAQATASTSGGTSAESSSQIVIANAGHE